MKRQILAVFALVCSLFMTASAVEFTGRMYWAEWNSKYDCGFWSNDKESWDGTHNFDAYMEVDGVKYPERSGPHFFLIPVELDKPGEKFTPVVVNGTTSGEVDVSMLTDVQVYDQFRNSQKNWMAYWLYEVFPNGKTRSSRAWIKVVPGQGKTTLRANVDLSKRPAAGIYSNYSMSALAAYYGINYFTGVHPVAPSTWYAIGIKETGEIFVPTESGLDSPRLYVSQLGEETAKDFPPNFVENMERAMGEDASEAVLCSAAWYVSAREAGGAELVLRANDIRKGTVSGNGIYAPNTQVTVRAEPYEGYLFAGWYYADGGRMLSASATFNYTTTDADATIVARFVDTTYKIVFAPGSDEETPSMPEQSVEVGKVAKLNPCTLAAPRGKKFAGWRRADTSRRYDDGVMVFDLAAPGEVVVMEAIWE